MLKRKKLLLYFFLFITTIVGFKAFAQHNYTPSSIKTAYILNFIKLIKWDNQDEFQAFRIGLFKKDSLLYKEINKSIYQKQIKSKKIEAVYIQSLKDISGLQILYLGEHMKKKVALKQILQDISGKNILLVTEEFDIENSMINFHTKRNYIRFEINEEKLEKENFVISGMLVTLSKSSNELKELYLETEQMLDNEKRIVESQRAQILQQKIKLQQQAKALNEQKQILKKQSVQLDMQAEKLRLQNEAISKKEKEIDSQNRNLQKLNKQLKSKQGSLQKKLDFIDKQDKKIQQQTNKINSQLKIMDKLNKELDNKLLEITNKDQVLSRQNIKIFNQRLTIIISSVFIVVVIILSFLVFRAYRTKIKINKELNRKNQAIVNQNIEIRQQQEEILSQNEEIERQKENLVKNQEALSIAYKKIEEKNKLLEIRNQYVTDGIEYAQKIQQSIFPSKSFISALFDEYFILFIPKDILSGDFYHFDKKIFASNDKPREKKEVIFFSAVDCTGHGVPGALMSIVGYNLLSQAINEYNIKQPSKILNFLNSKVISTLKHAGNESDIKDGMDIALCSYDKTIGLLEFAGAFNPLYICSNNSLQKFRPDIRPIGSDIKNQYTPFKNQVIPVKKGDNIYLFTDGFADQFGGDSNMKFMRKNLQKIIFENHHLPMEEQKTILEDVFYQWKGNNEQFDDVLIMGIRI